jgi:hypothetical protein
VRNWQLLTFAGTDFASFTKTFDHEAEAKSIWSAGIVANLRSCLSKSKLGPPTPSEPRILVLPDRSRSESSEVQKHG